MNQPSFSAKLYHHHLHLVEVGAVPVKKKKNAVEWLKSEREVGKQASYDPVVLVDSYMPIQGESIKQNRLEEYISLFQ